MVYQHQNARLVLPADATEAQLLRIISQEPVHVDDICNYACMPIETVTAALAMMELKGMVRQVGGMPYIAVRELPDAYNVLEEE
jgi:DNA processing protein